MKYRTDITTVFRTLKRNKLDTDIGKFIGRQVLSEYKSKYGKEPERIKQIEENKQGKKYPCQVFAYPLEFDADILRIAKEYKPKIKAKAETKVSIPEVKKKPKKRKKRLKKKVLRYEKVKT